MKAISVFQQKRGAINNYDTSSDAFINAKAECPN
jgi:hypothetical protein